MCCGFLRCCCCRRKNKRKISEDLIKLKEMAVNNEYMDGNIDKSTESVNNTLVAKYNYKNAESTCINVKKNDRFSIVESDGPDWKLVKNLHTNAIGYAPANIFVDENSLLREEWYFGNVTRIEVEASLLHPHHDDGTFLIRRSEENKTFPYVLSVKCDDPTRKCHVRHYRIFEDESSKQYFISEGLMFSSLAELVETYKSDELLCARLLTPCELSGPTVGTLSPKHKNWEIPKNEIIISKDRNLGNGQYSTVFHGIWNFNTDVAVKMIKDNSDLKDILKEVNIMKTLKHKNIVMLYGICTLNKPYWIVQEYLEYGDILSYIKQNDLSEKDNIYISYQIADGMSYLESRNIVHRDLAARNILLGSNNVVKVADLGLSRKLDGDGNYIISSELKLPVRWMSPESFITAQNSSKCDVWSFAILLIELYTNGAKPYPGFSNLEVVTKVQGGYRMPKPQGMPKNVYEIVSNCWKASPNKRPTFKELKMTFETLYEEFVES